MNRNPERDPKAYRFDIHLAGEQVQPRVPVVCTPAGIHFEDRQIPLASVFWVSRRAGLILVFARRHTVAFFGDSGDLEDFARNVERGSDVAGRRSLLRPLAADVVVCTAGTEIAGRIGEAPLEGLYLAVFTRRGLHLFAEEHEYTLRWPTEHAAETVADAHGDGRPVLELAKGDASFEIRYLFPEEIRAVLKVARTVPAPPDTDGALEMFDKGEVARPLRARLPDFSVGADTLQRVTEAAVERVRIDLSIGESFDQRYFERHFRTLGEIALGPLMLRRSAALEADSVVGAVQAMDAEQMRQDATAAFRGAAEELVRVYRAEVQAVVRTRRLDRDKGEKALAAAQEPALREAMSKHIDALGPAFDAALARQQLLLQQLHARDLAPPEAEEASVEEAIRAWTEEVTKLDRGYVSAAAAALLEIGALWSDRMIPGLRALAALRARRLSKRSRWAILAIVAFFVAAALAWLARDLI
ncbi:MAG: hypothetical protein F4164_05570 [Gemmatimonadales bacterium]|nr:hypothetical protein [Gemmatimonadales bacterium]MYG48838.1 hypothetical protein [Gemmatimonadales bacterium]MYK01246.1 hypothetical protein [Candidatus Palauibacter ramosifaciens]